MNTIKDKMTLLILSCNKFSDLWDGHVKQLETFWPGREVETYIVTDEYIDKAFDNVKVFCAGAGVEWTDRLYKALSMIETEYVFITLDDYFLIRPVSQGNIENLLYMMNQYHLDYLRLFKRPTKATREPIPGFSKAYYIDCSQTYSVNLYSGIWKTRFLRSCITESLNPWEFEVALSKQATLYGARGAVSNNRDFVILDVVRKGRLLHSAHYYFKTHPGIYEGHREVNTYRYEISLAIKTIVGRYTPVPVHNAIKRIMIRLGYSFYSE